MSLGKLNSMLMIAVIVLAAISCKKKDDTTNIVYVDGTLKFELPEFIHPGEVLTMKPKGLTHPDGGEIGYYWKVSPSMNAFDTTRFLNGLNASGQPSDGSFTFKFSDTLQTYTVYCNAFSEDYSTSTVNFSTTVVSPDLEGSITGTGIKLSDPYDKINGIEYYYTTIGDLDWCREDLALTTSGTPFRNGKAMDGVFGLFYNYEDALKACPEGWRLPTDEDWASLGKALVDNNEGTFIHHTIPGIAPKIIADAYFNNVKMWEYWPSMGKITNEANLGMIPTGFANLGQADKDGNYTSAEFSGVYEYAVYWTADKVEGNEDQAYYRYIYCKSPDMMVGKGDIKSFGANVRCVRNHI